MDLLKRIEAYLERSGTTATRFGREALGDPCFVHDLRQGRELRPSTSARVIEHLAEVDEEREFGR